MADHRRETGVDLALLAAADLVDGGSHIVVDSAPRHAAQHAEGVVMGVEQHLVGLLRIGPENEGAAVGELEVGDLQFGPLAADEGPVFRPVELEGFSGHERPGYENATAGGLLLSLPSRPPIAGKGRHAMATSPHRPSTTRSACNCLIVRFCLRDFPVSCRSMCESLSACRSSLLGRSGMLNFGSSLSERRYLRTVFIDSPVRRDISRATQNDREMDQKGTHGRATTYAK